VGPKLADEVGPKRVDENTPPTPARHGRPTPVGPCPGRGARSRHLPPPGPVRHRRRADTGGATLMPRWNASRPGKRRGPTPGSRATDTACRVGSPPACWALIERDRRHVTLPPDRHHPHAGVGRAAVRVQLGPGADESQPHAAAGREVAELTPSLSWSGRLTTCGKPGTGPRTRPRRGGRRTRKGRTRLG
jgi:hypothetical protein